MTPSAQGTLILIPLTLVADIFIHAVLIGLAYGAVTSTHKYYRRWREVFILMGVLALLDVYYQPAMLLFDATVTIGNPAIAGLLGRHQTFQLGEALGIGFSDVPLWFIQAIIARAAAQWARDRITAEVVSPSP